jgi:hypothetical protein
MDSRCIILDLKRVSTIDLTGAQLLRQIVDLIKDKGNHLLLAYLDIPGDRDKERLRSFMDDLGVPDIVGHDHIFPDTDHALEWAEDHIIEGVTECQQDRCELELQDLSVFKDLSPAQLNIVHQYARPLSCPSGTIICKEGEQGDGVYFILSGYVSVYTGDRAHRLATFAEGVYFGEMALLEDKPRSATVRAETETKLLTISREDFQKLTESEPSLAAHILLGIARELSHRLRMTNAEVTALEE